MAARRQVARLASSVASAKKVAGSFGASTAISFSQLGELVRRASAVSESRPLSLRAMAVLRKGRRGLEFEDIRVARLRVQPASARALAERRAAAASPVDNHPVSRQRSGIATYPCHAELVAYARSSLRVEGAGPLAAQFGQGTQTTRSAAAAAWPLGRGPLWPPHRHQRQGVSYSCCGLSFFSTGSRTRGGSMRCPRWYSLCPGS
jgi:hypothetical protein